MVPLHYRRSCSVHEIFMDLLALFSFLESSARKSFDGFVGACLLPAASYFMFPIVK